MYLCGPGKHNCQPFCGPEGRFYCSDSVCSLWPAPFSYLCVSVMILCVCWKLSAAGQVKTDCWHTPAVVSTLLTPLPGSLSCSTPLRSITTLALREQDERSYPRPQQVEWPRPRPQQTTLMMMASHQHHRRRVPQLTTRLATSTTDVAVPQLTTPASHQHHRRPRLATNTTDVAVPQLTTPASHQHHRRPRLATNTIDAAGQQSPSPRPDVSDWVRQWRWTMRVNTEESSSWCCCGASSDTCHPATTCASA